MITEDQTTKNKWDKLGGIPGHRPSYAGNARTKDSATGRSSSMPAVTMDDLLNLAHYTVQ